MKYRILLLIICWPLLLGAQEPDTLQWWRDIPLDTLGLSLPTRIQVSQGLLEKGQEVTRRAREVRDFLSRLDSLQSHPRGDTTGLAELYLRGSELMGVAAEPLAGAYPSEVSPKQLRQLGRKVRRRMIHDLRGAVEEFSRALERDPLNEELLQNVAACYADLAALYQSLEAYEEAIATYERLVKLAPGEYTYVWDLADLHHRLGQDLRAYELYCRAEDLLLESFYFNDSLGRGPNRISRIPPALRRYWGYLIQSQAEMAMNLNLADNARLDLERALLLADPADVPAIRSSLQWLAEFGYHIRFNHLYEKALRRMEQKEWLPAAVLLQELSREELPPSGKLKVLNTLAQLQYYKLHQYAPGLTVMRRVVELAPQAVADSLQREYAENFAYMLYDHGLRLRRTSVKDAARLFQVGAQQPGRWRAANLLELAALYSARPEKVVELVQQALADEEQMTLSDRIAAYQMLNEAYRKQGDLAAARSAYDRYLELYNSRKQN